jgi:phosphoenolpyruvate phosphomutase
VCIEDKLFPKTNSLLDGRAQPLADPEEFALKITAMKVCTKPPTSQCFFAVQGAPIAGTALAAVGR